MGKSTVEFSIFSWLLEAQRGTRGFRTMYFEFHADGFVVKSFTTTTQTDMGPAVGPLELKRTPVCKGPFLRLHASLWEGMWAGLRFQRFRLACLGFMKFSLQASGDAS